MRHAVRVFKNKEDSLRFGLSFFLIAGSVLGTIFCNWMTEDMKQELMIMRQSTDSVTKAMISELNFHDFFLRILVKRIWTLMIMILVTATPMASWLIMLAAGYFGFSNAVMISVWTMGMGFRGLLGYAVTIFPQCLCYIPIAYLMLWWIPVKEKRLTWLSVLALVGLTAIGAVLESFINPWLMTIV